MADGPRRGDGPSKDANHPSAKIPILTREKMEAIGNRMRIIDREERKIILAKDELRRRVEDVRALESSIRTQQEALSGGLEEIRAGREEIGSRSAALCDLLGIAPTPGSMADDDIRARLQELERRAHQVPEAEARLASANEQVARLEEDLRKQGEAQRARESSLRESASLLRERERAVGARESQMRIMMPLMARWSLSAQSEEASFQNAEALSGLQMPEGVPPTLRVAKAALMQEIKDLLRKEEMLALRERELEAKKGLVDRREREERDVDRRALSWRAQAYGFDRG